MPEKKLKVSLTIVEGQEKGKFFDLDQKKVTIGRTAGDIRLNDPKISRKHAQVEIKKGKVYLTDLNSTNGVFVNDEKIETVELKNLDQITIGFLKISVAIVEDLQSFKEKNIPIKGRKIKQKGEDISETDIGAMIEEELSKFSRWDVSSDKPENIPAGAQISKTIICLEVIEGPDRGKMIKLKVGTTVLGRGKADIALKDTDVSRAHCEVEIYSKDQVFLRDLASTNGSYINNKKVSYSRLREGDVIQIGGTMLRMSFVD